MLVKSLMTKLFYGAFMFMFISSFEEYAKITVKRVIKYSLIGLIYYPLIFVVPMSWDHRVMLMITLITFFAFEGTFIEKASCNIVAEAVWAALHLLNEVVLIDSIEIMVTSEDSTLILLDLICFVELCCILRFLGQTAVFKQDTNIKHQLSVSQQLGMIVLAVEGDIVVWIASIVFYDGIKIIVSAGLTAFVLCIAGLYLICFALSLDSSIAKEYYKVTNKTLEKQIQSQYSYYQKLERVTKETRAIKHDMKNHLIVMKGMAEKGDLKSLNEYLDNIQTTIEGMSVVVHTGNSIVDSIVNEKLEIAQSRNIEMKLDVSLQEDLGVTAMDLCVMIANSLDNAIEACDKIPEGSKKYISVYGRFERGYLSFIIANTVAKNVYISNNIVITDKSDKLNHGYGLQNIKNTVKRNHGKVKIECEDEVFSIYIDIQNIQNRR